jgi:hypothetical protein
MFKYYVDASITFLSDKILNVRQTLYIASGSAPAARWNGESGEQFAGGLYASYPDDGAAVIEKIS